MSTLLHSSNVGGSRFAVRVFHFVVLLDAVCFATKPDEWDAFKTVYGKKYGNASEETRRYTFTYHGSWIAFACCSAKYYGTILMVNCVQPLSPPSFNRLHPKLTEVLRSEEHTSELQSR